MNPKEEKLFLERLGVMAALESAGEWQDGWSPTAVLEGKKGYVATTGATNRNTCTALEICRYSWKPLITQYNIISY